MIAGLNVAIGQRHVGVIDDQLAFVIVQGGADQIQHAVRVSGLDGEPGIKKGPTVKDDPLSSAGRSGRQCDADAAIVRVAGVQLEIIAIILEAEAAAKTAQVAVPHREMRWYG